MGLIGIITFDPFYKTNNTLILHALAELQHDFGHSQCYANRTRRQSRLVRFASLQMSSMHVALPLMHSDACIIVLIMHVLIHSHKLAAKTAFMHGKQSELNSGSSHFSFNDKSRYK